MSHLKHRTAVDRSSAQGLTVGMIDRFTCPSDKTQVFLRDSKAPGLRIRATAPSTKNPAGTKAFVFEAKLQGQTIRTTIGDVRSWTIEAARIEANRLRVGLDSGRDPREVAKAEMAAKADAARAIELARAKNRTEQITVGEVWADYMDQRRPFWGELHYRDHVDKSKAGGVPSGRRGGGKTLTKPGPLASLLALPLRKLDQATLESWAAEEGKIRPASARLAWRLLTVFLTWCSDQEAYAALLPDKNPAKTKKAREALGRSGVKTDVLQRGQLAAWFSQVQQLSNPTIRACLQVMLLTGARPGEVLTLRWEDISLQWRSIRIRDKVEGTRQIPATPYVFSLLQGLPRRRMPDGTQNSWLFSSATSASGCLSKPNTPHAKACKAAGLEGLTLHGLRRSFKSLTEWLEVPTGVVAQIQGHKPSATAEKHYTVRPLELLALHHERIEAWILEEAHIAFDAATTTRPAPSAIGR